MKLDLFHIPDNSNYNYHVEDLFNSRTKRLTCQFLEWTGWYSQTIEQRLLGHYRLFQLYKKHHPKFIRALTAIDSYILHYRSGIMLKYRIAQALCFASSICTWGRPYPAVEVEYLNRILLNQACPILIEFLQTAETDFETALTTAVAKIKTPGFVAFYSSPSSQTENKYIQINNNITLAEPPTATELQGKQTGVFSKKQILIFFDLISGTGKIEKFDLSNPNKYEGICTFFGAITGKTPSAIRQELENYRHKGLYEYHTKGEFNQLINTITNLSETCRKAGLRSISNLADKKIFQLESQPKPWQ